MSSSSELPLTYTARPPRSSSDDYAADIVTQRREWLEQTCGANLSALSGGPGDPHVFRGNIESLIGTLQLPVGIAGPLLIHG